MPAGRCPAADAVDRLSAERLEAVHQAVLKLQGQRRDLPRSGPLKEYRANLHVHSAWSHDSRGKIEQIVAAARRVGTHVLLFSEHPAPHYDFVRDGHQGVRDGVLLIPGAETSGLLVYPRQSLAGLDSGSPQQLVDLVRGRGGLAFLSHLEERMDWELRGLTGVEIYNTHADFKSQRRLLAALKNPLWLLGAAERLQRYPQAAFSALQNYPADYLRRWDELCQIARHTGVSANDAHQNVGLTIRRAAGGKARIEDALGEKLLELDAALVAPLLPESEGQEPGAVWFQLLLDPYEVSLRHVATHLLLPELSADAVRQGLEESRAFVAFDWMADATGFDCSTQTGGRRYEIGSRFALAGDLRLVGHAPLAAHWKLVRDGKLHAQSRGTDFDMGLGEPGAYRLELWLDLAGEERVWILTNPFYVTGA